MIVPKAELNEFTTFMGAVFGVAVTLRHNKDEYGRFMFRGRFFVIRDNAGEGGETLEVHSSDRQLLDEVDKMWTIHFLNRSKDHAKSSD